MWYAFSKAPILMIIGNSVAGTFPLVIILTHVLTRYQGIEGFVKCQAIDQSWLHQILWQMKGFSLNPLCSLLVIPFWLLFLKMVLSFGIGTALNWWDSHNLAEWDKQQLQLIRALSGFKEPDILFLQLPWMNKSLFWESVGCAFSFLKLSYSRITLKWISRIAHKGKLHLYVYGSEVLLKQLSFIYQAHVVYQIVGETIGLNTKQHKKSPWSQRMYELLGSRNR
jgi:hypothetical protein